MEMPGRDQQINPFVIENNILTRYCGAEPSVWIPGEVSKIGKEAFAGSTVKEVNFTGCSIVKIEESAFANCTELDRIELPQGVVEIGANAFSGCLNLQYIFIPASASVIDDSAFDNVSSHLVVVGTKGSDAEKIANQHKLIFSNNLSQITSAMNNRNKALDKVEKRTFDIWGEKIFCSNTIIKYHEILIEANQRKETFFNQFKNCLPTQYPGIFGQFKELLDQEQDILISRLMNQGVFIKKDSLSLYIYNSYVTLLDVLQSIKKVYDSVTVEVQTGIANQRQQLINEAESKIVGLGYGIIGDSLSLLAYELDDIRERKRQRQTAYEEAEKKFAAYQNDTKLSANTAYSAFMDKSLPFLRQGTDMFIDGLFRAECDFLANSGLLDKTFINSLDISKSAELVQSVPLDLSGASFTIALALIKYPYNLSAFVYAYEHNLTCEGLTELVEFLNLSEPIAKAIKKNHDDKVNSMIMRISQMSNATACLDYIRDNQSGLTDAEIKRLQGRIPSVITPKIEALLKEKPNHTVSDVRDFCAKKISSVITKNAWDELLSLNIRPIRSATIPLTASTEYESCIDWICNKIAPDITERHNQYKVAMQKFKTAKKIADYQEIAIAFEKLGNYLDSASNFQKAQSTYKQMKAKRIKVISISLLSILLVVGLLSYFVAYPMLALASGDYNTYVNMYNIKEFTIPESDVDIDNFAFYECDSLESITIHDNISSIGENAFDGCKNLISVEIPDSVGVIGEQAFDGCSSLTSVVIGRGVHRIDSEAFKSCSKLKSITYRGTMAEWEAINKDRFWDYCTWIKTVYCSDGIIADE